ncbi:hypothetical protein HID58_068495 [Brassica napus]|uniref:Uncharacterized protein n=1 Tax=Brassica napus TaxID=3708 RepID=A0ABQ7ZLF8_BRANA|nr:hypothetical protein HID58_068495 [Brassica napus]
MIIRRVLLMAKPVLVRNTEEMMMNLNFPNCIKVAELDCSSGQNAFLAISEIINTISVLCQQSNQNPPEIDCCLNDLPENDFNATFKSIPFFNKELMITNQASLHLIHSSYALHWLSKVPEKLVNDKENVYITNAKTHEYDLGHSNCDNQEDDEAGYNEANCIRAVTESMLVVHFGEDIIDILFDKYARHVTQHASRRNKTSVTLVVALTKK